MRELIAEPPLESPAGTDAVERLVARLTEEGFKSDQSDEDWRDFGERIFSRTEQISFANGETVFIFTRIPTLNERILRQTSESVVNTFKAKSTGQKALSVLQATTVYHCLVCTDDQPYNEPLAEYITRSGGATFIPVIIVPGINQVLYPHMDEKIGGTRSRVEYLQYLLGERREPVNMHKQTVQAFWVSMGVAIIVLVAIAFSFIT
jgi:hypothetical protein